MSGIRRQGTGKTPIAIWEGISYLSRHQVRLSAVPNYFQSLFEIAIGWFQLQSLAWLEMYTSLAMMFSRFEMSLFETPSLEWLDHGIAVHQSPVQVSYDKA